MHAVLRAAEARRAAEQEFAATEGQRAAAQLEAEEEAQRRVGGPGVLS